MSKTPNLTNDFLAEYYAKTKLLNMLRNDTSDMSKQIKYEMQKFERVNFETQSYKIKLESKFEPNKEFFELVYKKELHYLITPSITASNLKSAKRKLQITEEDYFTQYAKEKESKWLYINQK